MEKSLKERPYILIIEDDQTYATVYNLKLAKEGFRVEFASNGEEALRILEKGKPDLIILDLILPIMDGFEVLKRIRSNPDWKDIKVIVLSVLGQEEDKKRVQELGIVDYFVKSEISINEVIKRIHAIL